MVIVNGCPKSGTHALMALLDTMGLKRCPGTILPMHGYLYVNDSSTKLSVAMLRAIPDNCYVLAHVPAKYNMVGFRIMTIKRDPRDVLVSYCRHREREDGLNVTVQQALAKFWDWGPFVPLYRSFLGWSGRSIMIRYEDMPQAMIGDGSGIYRGHAHDWNTRTGAPSQWANVWSERIEAAWVDHGGPSLLEEAGYS